MSENSDRTPPRLVRGSVRPMTRGDLDVVARMHAEHFPRNVAVRFGRAFVREYLRLFVDGSCAVAFVATRGDEIRGYLVGVTSTAGHRPHVRARMPRLVITAGPRLLLNLLFLARVLKRKVGHRLQGPSGAATPPPGPIAVLSHVAVSSECRQSGLGSALVMAFETAAARSGARTAALATVDGEDGAGEFYVDHGWRLAGCGVTVDQRRLQLYEKSLGTGGAGR